MSVHIIKMPDLGEGIAEVELVAWHVQPGDQVTEDQPLADVMTEKATVEIPSPVVGKVLALGAEVGKVLAVGAELIRIETEDGAGAPVAAQEASDAAETAEGALSRAAPSQAQALSASADAAGAPADAISAAGRSYAAGAARPIRPDGHPLASPAVRQHARQLDIELHRVTGSGPGGRILHQDLEAFAADASAAPGLSQAQALYQARHDELAVPVIGLRRRIAQNMQEALRIPHFTYVEEVDVTEIEALRAQLNTRFGAERGHLTLLPLLLRAVVLAVREFPQMNARFDDKAGVVTQYGAVHAGIATQTAAGLMVPVLRHAESHSPWASAQEIVRLAEAARAGKARREELGGSTITITSLGALGGIVSTPVINHPEVAIIGVNRMALRPMIRDGAVMPRKMMNLSSSFDHRVIDGMHAAEFVQSLRGLLECPALLFVE